MFNNTAAASSLGENRAVFASEYGRRLRAGVIGCGSQMYRNILPCLNFAPLDLLAVCDTNAARARATAAAFGAPQIYTSIAAMLDTGRLDVILIASGYDDSGNSLHPTHARLAMQAGCDVWMEKPPASTSEEVVELRKVEIATGRYVNVGFMKMFTPAAARIREIVKQEAFGAISSVYLRDPEQLPSPANRGKKGKENYLLDHLVHPLSLLRSLVGTISRIHVERGSSGAGVVSLFFANGACGVLHMPWGQSKLSPMERLEVVGDGENVVLDRGTHLTYYRKGHRGSSPQEYGRGIDFTSNIACAPLQWSIDGYSGQPYNTHIFYQGYAQCLLAFCERVFARTPPSYGGLEDAWFVMNTYEAIRDGHSKVIDLPVDPPHVFRADLR